MAKRKASRRGRPASGSTPPVRRQAPAQKARSVARKAVAKKRPVARPARPKAAAKRAGPKGAAVGRAPRATAKARGAKSRAATKAAAPKSRRTATLARKVVSPKTVARKAAKPQPKVVARKTATATLPKVAVPRLAPTRALPAAKQAKRKHVLDLGRERRRVQGDEVVSPTPPSSLHLDRTASAARSGRQGLRERYDNHNETSPAMTGGDVDADWESAYAVGDETPGGDNPTPDQNVVDDIGVAVGVQYKDNEELEGAARIEERDRHRWEFDPASSDDFDER